MPPKWGFSPICDPPRFFFKNRALSLLYPYGALTSSKKLEKLVFENLKTDGPADQRTRAITKDPSGKLGADMITNLISLLIQNIYSKRRIHTFIDLY